MSKIICDVCGTSYPETATQCPICGCVRPSDISAVVGTHDDDALRSAGSYTHVKGGRFSKSNVKKRTYSVSGTDEAAAEFVEKSDSGKGIGEEKGLIIAVCALLLAIIAAVIYIALNLFAPGGDVNITDGDKNGNNTTITQQYPCTDITLSKGTITFAEIDASELLSVTLEPSNTTDSVTFVSADPAVATVTKDGLVTAVGKGETTITVTCGEKTAVCTVICNIEQEEEPVNPPEPVIEFKFNTPYKSGDKWDATLKVGNFWRAYRGEIPADEITWSSANPDVAKVEDGLVTAVSSGRTEIKAVYKDVEYVCIVRCTKPATAETETTQPDQ
ncbi:MAG: Ig-like domain-containing protein [Oscillospiraceae bacterium]|nr:Ig-like domain-containing protein [Oscillospiraceae bacterium]